MNFPGWLEIELVEKFIIFIYSHYDWRSSLRQSFIWLAGLSFYRLADISNSFRQLLIILGLSFLSQVPEYYAKYSLRQGWEDINDSKANKENFCWDSRVLYQDLNRKINQNTGHVEPKGGCMPSHCFDVKLFVHSWIPSDEIKCCKQVDSGHYREKPC